LEIPLPDQTESTNLSPATWSNLSRYIILYISDVDLLSLVIL
jgi:hypothetical protein